MNQIELDEVADRLIAYIRKRPGHFFDWQRLTARLRIDLETLNRAIDTAVSWDYRLRMRRSKGVAFVEPPDSLTATEIKWNLKTKWLGQTVCSYRSVRSTNDLATQIWRIPWQGQ